MTQRPTPAAVSSPYITEEGFAALQGEVKDIWKKRVEVTAALSAAAAEGDRSENAEYIYRKKQLREIDRRLGFLQRRIPVLTIVSEVGDRDKVFFGAWVALEKEGGGEVVYRIVGGDEIQSDIALGYISIDSPMARAMLSKKVGDVVELELTVKVKETVQDERNQRSERRVFYIRKIWY